ncbi:MAG: valine--tRNA ligase [Bryobacteraceae bacterium]
MTFETVYEPQRFEQHWARWWVETGIYRADPTAPGPRFSLVIPPPNVTGSLHMGHMLDHTIMDAAVRWHRMIGDNTLWLPGVDHAGIATQMVVERMLAEDGLTRQQLGREEFERRVWQWKEKYGNRITDQMKAIGDSVDWSREAFTLSPQLSRAVREAFVTLYQRGLIYRGAYMVNWCPRCQTAISDLETVHQDVQGSLWHIRYPVTGSERFLTVATTRPETMLGDTAVAVNPKDQRYFDLHGKTVTLPLMDRIIPIILDDFADPAFGSGVVKVTPAHDVNDLEAAKRHNLPHIQVIDGQGRMTPAAGPYAGLDRFAARKKIVADLDQLGLLAKIEPHALSIAKCDRCKTVIEPLVSTQWFVRARPLAAKVLSAVEAGSIRFIPENWNNTFFNWMNNIRDWCISRQLWWGHRIPAWHCADCRGITVGQVSDLPSPQNCEHCGSSRIEQDPDVLDTWFSSSLWPFSTLGWPDQTEDLKTFYPTSLLITGFDIIFFWVARMMMMGLELTNDVPFRVVHMHGLVRDAEGQKMSKTKGNVIDPLNITARFGTDAVRLSLLMGVAAGTDITYTEEKLTSAQKFANKIWNASRLIFLNMERSVGQVILSPASVAEPCAIEDRWIFSRLDRTAKSVNHAFEQHRYHEAAETLYHFFWHDLCDWYLEIKKLRLTENSGMTNDWRNLLSVYAQSLRLLHPIMPFQTEELWHRLGRADSISLQPYPQSALPDASAEKEMSLLQDIITDARVQRSKFPKHLRLKATLHCESPVEREIVEKLANLDLTILPGQTVKLVLETPAPDKQTQHARLSKEIAQFEKLIATQDRQLANEKFLASAPAHIIESLRAKRSEYQKEWHRLSSLCGPSASTGPEHDR